MKRDGGSDFAGNVTSMMFLRSSLIQERIAEGYSAGRAALSPMRDTLTPRQNTLPHPLRL